jgi:hypothetical protein
MSMLFAFHAASFSAPAPVGAQTSQKPQPTTIAQLSSGCSGSGPGILTGRTPGFGTGSAGIVRIIPGDANGDAFMAAASQMDTTLQYVTNLQKDPKALAEFEKNAATSPYITHYTGPNNVDAVLAWEHARIESSQRANAAVSEMATTIVAKDGSFTCRGLRSGKYHVMIQFFARSPATATSLAAPGHGSQINAYEASAEVPRAEPGQHVLVEVNGYRQLMSIKQ